MSGDSRAPGAADLREYLLWLGDDALIAAQRLAEWCAVAPEMEEDVALANIALDQLGAARLWLSYAADLTGEPAASGHPAATGEPGATEDTLAFLRDPADFRNCLLVELPNGDFAVTIARLLFLSTYQHLLYGALTASSDERLAGIAAAARVESAYHVDHATQWTLRLGDGTEESHRRLQVAVAARWPYTSELFAPEALTARLARSGVAVDHASLRDEWLSAVTAVLDKATIGVPGGLGAVVLDEATLGVPGGQGAVVLDEATVGVRGGSLAGAAQAGSGGGARRGRHTVHLAALLAEMQVVHRAHPGARW